MTINEKILKPGDILLYNGKSWISWAIKSFDSSPVSHAGIYLGNGRVGEALAQGVIRQPLSDSIKGANWVKVYRHAVSEDGDNMEPVIKQAKEFIKNGHQYAYEQILLLAYICTTRKMVGNKNDPYSKRIVQRAIDNATHINKKWFSSNKELMICSEFVYRCFEFSDKELRDRYSIQLRTHDKIGAKPLARTSTKSDAPERTFSAIEPESLWDDVNRANQWASDNDELEELIEQYRKFIKTGENSDFAKETGIVPRETLVHGTKEFIKDLSNGSFTSTVNPDWVTPRDIFYSPSLRLMGELW